MIYEALVALITGKDLKVPYEAFKYD